MSCKGKDHSNCGSECMWIREHTDKRGRVIKAHCQKKPSRKKSSSPKRRSPKNNKKASKRRSPHKVIDLTADEWWVQNLKELGSDSSSESSSDESVFVGKTNRSRVIEDDLDDEYEKAQEWARNIPVAWPSKPVYGNEEPVNVLQVRRKPRKIVPTAVPAALEVPVVPVAPVTPVAPVVPVAPVAPAAPVNVLQVRRKPRPVAAIPLAPAAPAAPIPSEIVNAVPISRRSENAPKQCIKAFQRFYDDLPTSLQVEVKPYMPPNVSQRKKSERKVPSKSPEKKPKLTEKQVQSAVKAMVTKFLKSEEGDIDALEEQIIKLYTKNEHQPDPEFLIDQGERIYDIEYVDITDTYREEADAEELEAQEDLHNFVDDIMAGDFVNETVDFSGTLLGWFKEYKVGTSNTLARSIAQYVLDTGRYESESFQKWTFEQAEEYVKDTQPEAFVAKVVDDISVLRAKRFQVDLSGYFPIKRK